MSEPILIFPYGDAEGILNSKVVQKQKSSHAEQPIRELLQNSFDAAGAIKKQADIHFVVEEIDIKDMPLYKQYEREFDNIKSYWENKGIESMARKEFDKITKALNLPKIKILSVIDNGNGFSRERIENLFAQNSNKGSYKDACGSYGQGHLTAYGLSHFRYVTYVGKSKDNGRLKTIYSGSVILAGQEEAKEPLGYWGRLLGRWGRLLGCRGRLLGCQGRLLAKEPTDRAIRDYEYPNSSSLPGFLKKHYDKIKDTGSIVSIIGFNGDLDENFKYTIVSNFFMAMLDKRISLSITKGDETTTLDENRITAILKARQSCGTRRGGVILSGRETYRAYRVIQDKECLKEIKLDKHNKVKCYIDIGDEEPQFMAIFRGGMIISSNKSIVLKSKLEQLPKISQRRKFSVLISLEQSDCPDFYNLMKEIEGPHHKELDIKNASQEDREKIRSYCDDLYEGIINHVPELETEDFPLPVLRLFPNSKMSFYSASQYPIYSPKVKNYQNNAVYDVEVGNEGEGQYLVTQRVTGKSSFIYQVLKDRKAEFCITYKIKDSLTRKTHKYLPTRESEQEIIGEYLIEDIPKGLSFTLIPSIFLLEKEEIHISPNNTYGSNKSWCADSPILFPKYSKIARSTPINSSDVDNNHLFITQLSESLKKGQLKVEFYAHNEEIPFHVQCAEDVYYFLKSSSDENLKTAIKSQILVGSLSEVRSYYQANGDYGSSEKLDLLKEYIREQGMEDWTMDDFNPSKVGTKLLPFKIIQIGRLMPNYYLYPKDKWQDFGQSFLKIKEGDKSKYALRNDFFEACKDKRNFLDFIEEYLKNRSGETPPPILNIKLTEKEFIKPPEETQREIYAVYKNIPDQYVHDPTFWFCVNLEMIKKDMIKPSFLAHDDKFNGQQKLDLLINNHNGNNKDKDIAVRKILRRLCNTEPRGKRTLIEPNDCPISGVYWRQDLIARIEEASEGRLEAKEVSSRFNMDLYKKICEQLFSGKSYYGDPRILAGLVIFLKNDTGIKKEGVENLLEGMGKIIASKAIDVAEFDEIVQEFDTLAKTN